MAVNVQVIFYSTYGHVYRLAEAIAEGAREVPGTEVKVFQVADTGVPTAHKLFLVRFCASLGASSLVSPAIEQAWSIE